LNAWFRRHAWHNHAAGISRVSVICDAGNGLIAGYVTLSAAQIERDFLAKAQQRNKPDPQPACWASLEATKPTSARALPGRFCYSR
jgi:hypothetical protein